MQLDYWTAEPVVLEGPVDILDGTPELSCYQMYYLLGGYSSHWVPTASRWGQQLNPSLDPSAMSDFRYYRLTGIRPGPNWLVPLDWDRNGEPAWAGVPVDIRLRPLEGWGGFLGTTSIVERVGLLWAAQQFTDKNLVPPRRLVTEILLSLPREELVKSPLWRNRRYGPWIRRQLRGLEHAMNDVRKSWRQLGEVTAQFQRELTLSTVRGA